MAGFVGGVNAVIVSLPPNGIAITTDHYASASGISRSTCTVLILYPDFAISVRSEVASLPMSAIQVCGGGL